MSSIPSIHIICRLLLYTMTMTTKKTQISLTIIFSLPPKKICLYHIKYMQIESSVPIYLLKLSNILRV